MVWYWCLYRCDAEIQHLGAVAWSLVYSMNRPPSEIVSSGSSSPSISAPSDATILKIEPGVARA